ncbi:MAG: VCBS repeat-containing protein [Thermodesulfobacteriota bacterium]
MRISDTSVALASAHSYRESFRSETSLRLWVGSERPDFEGDGPASRSMGADLVTLSQAGLDRQKRMAHAGNSAAVEPPAPVEEDPKLHAIRLILEALTGKKITVAAFTPSATIAPAPPATATAGGDQPPRQGWGLEYDSHEVYREVETLRFAAGGEIRTADGQTIRFHLEFAMRREYVQETHLSLRAGDARLIDPLLVNFNGTAAQLGDQRFLFDLDMDGKADEIPLLGAGSGFLALDRNSDGVINNGAELFGPATGHGFAELRELDSDRNGWLDENDPLFAKLRIWMRDAAGNDALFSLKEKNIGALLLDPVDTPFAFTGSANSLQDRLRETSVYLTESGGAGTIQEVDIALQQDVEKP